MQFRRKSNNNKMQRNKSVFLCFCLSLLLTRKGLSAAIVASSPTATAKQSTAGENNLLDACPNILTYVFENSTPRDEYQAGVFEEYTELSMESEDADLHNCISACCEKEREVNNTCNVVFIFKRKCYHVRCISNAACLPKERQTKTKDRLQMILVNPVKTAENISWFDVLKASKANNNNNNNNNIESYWTNDLAASNENGSPLSFWRKPPHKYRYPIQRIAEEAVAAAEQYPLAEKRVKPFLLPQDSDGDDSDDLFYNADAANVKYISCSFDNPACPSKQECVPLQPNAAAGICRCMRDYIRNQLHECVPREMDYQFLQDVKRKFLMSAAASENMPMLAKTAVADDKLQAQALRTSSSNEDDVNTEKPEIKSNKIQVSVESKEVRLPEQEVSLTAITLPDEIASGSHYSYLWTLINQPKGPMNGTISDQSNAKVKLSNLSVGLYTFKVSVTGNNSYGEALANVTVLPEKRINRLPQVIITPSKQEIRQPTTNAILDGSTSTDDDKIINYKWEVVSGPIGYQPKLPEVSTLQLTDLTAVGNYTFRLTVTDSDQMSNSTTANITVLKGTDYPPVANAGDAVVLYLPNNNVTLNGTASSDDHEIVAWEWTKDANDEAKAVDMQNTRTPYAQLSNLEEGMYTFVLKVTDGSGQSSSAKVHVFVKPPTNSPPVAVAGVNATLNLPRNWALLDGTKSTDDIRIQSYHWKQLSGPNVANIINASAALANATAMTLGLYQFELSVTDESNNTATDSVWIKIVQEKNAAPVSNAGGDKTITLPISALYLNGSNSWDDLAVTNYSWTRDDNSLAAGLIVGNTDSQPVLIVTNLVAGQYIFKLKVSDEQGLSSTDTVKITVQPDPMLMQLVQLTLPNTIFDSTQGYLNSIVQKVSLLLGDMTIHVRELKYDEKTKLSQLVFYVESINAGGQLTPVDGLTIELLLKNIMKRDPRLASSVYSDVRTVICQNKCSGHGVCDAVSRACICESFWMPSATYFWGLEEANCDWSILYVFVCVILVFCLLSGIFWSIACACRQTKKPRVRPKMQKYSLIGTHDEETPQFRRSNSLSDSDTDSDVLFETRTKPNGMLRTNGSTKMKNQQQQQHNHEQRKKYSMTKLGRKIKT